MKNWKKQYVYEVPVVFSDPWGRKFFVIDDVFYNIINTLYQQATSYLK